MATEFTDIYLNGINFEELHAGGGKIVETWLDGKCIWRLVGDYISVIIHYITWYNNMYYAIGQVRTPKYGNWSPSILIGETINNLKAYRHSIEYSEPYPMTNYSSGWGIFGISCDKNGMWMARETYIHVPHHNSILTGKMFLHSGFEFIDTEKRYLLSWFDDNNTLNIPKSRYNALSIGSDLYAAYLADTSPITTTGAYKINGKNVTLLETIDGWYKLAFNIEYKAYMILAVGPSNLSEYTWRDPQNTLNPNYKIPLIHIRSLPEWGDKGIVYLPLGEIYQILKNQGSGTISFYGFELLNIAISGECMIAIAVINLNFVEFYLILSFDGSVLKQKIFTEYPFNFRIDAIGDIGEKFYLIGENNEEDRRIMSVFDSIDNVLNAKKFIIDKKYSRFANAFIRDDFLYLIKSNMNIDAITWLKINLETLESSEDTVEIA